jgi:putative toxin-antitoxin system antitoxin component (TIGR02293 family)
MPMKRHSSYLEPGASRESAASSPNEHEAAVLARAVEVIGDKGEAMRWMGTPVRALKYATPVSLIHNARGRKAVIEVLGRLENGVL